MSEDENTFMITGSFLAGVLLGFFSSSFLYFVSPRETNYIKIFNREKDNLSVMRAYKSGRDEILVNDSIHQDYIPLDNYLSRLERLKDKADIKIEKEEIKKAVEWYKN